LRKYCRKICDLEAARDALIWNFFIDFFYIMALEISISLSLQYTILNVNKTRIDTCGIALFWFFALTSAAFLIFLTVFYFFTCNPAQRMEEYEKRVGALY
jgi:hypothetical protein